MVRRFSPYGLRSEAMHACYAMAENVFAVTTTSDAHPAKRLTVRRDRWHEAHRAEPVTSDAEAAVVHVSSGRPVMDCIVRIADDTGAALPPLVAGRILIRSPAISL